MFSAIADPYWVSNMKFGSGVAKAIARRIDASGGGDQSWRLDYEDLADDLEFTADEIRNAVATMISRGYARIEHDRPGCPGPWLLLLTPKRLAADAAQREAARRKAEERAAKIALRGGQVNRAPISQELREFVFARDGRACLRCKATEGLTLDHIKPWSLGGPDAADNLQTLCRSCNSRKGDRA